MIFYVLAGLAAGICAGLYFPVYIPPEYGKMLSVALMAVLDTAFGGIRSSMEGLMIIRSLLRDFLLTLCWRLFCATLV